MASSDDRSAPCYIRYSLRGLGLFAGLFCLVFGVLNFIFHPLSLLCVIFSIVQICLGCFVASSEAAGSPVRICHCVTFEKFPSCTDWMDQRPSWIKPLFYILSPMLGMILCTTWFTFFGGGMVILSGVVYAIHVFRRKDGFPENTPSSRSPISSPPPSSGPTIIRVDNRSPTTPTPTFTTTATLTKTESRNPMGFSDRYENADLGRSFGRPATLTSPTKTNEEAETGFVNESYRYENIQTISGSGGGRKVVVDYTGGNSSVHPSSATDDNPFVTNWERSDRDGL